MYATLLWTSKRFPKINKPLVVYRYYCMALFHSQTRRHMIKLFPLVLQDCEFLKKCLSIPWTLSTSQAPQQQLASSPHCDLPKFRDKVFNSLNNDSINLTPGMRKFWIDQDFLIEHWHMMCIMSL